jgi:hypothetical protein
MYRTRKFAITAVASAGSMLAFSAGAGSAVAGAQQHRSTREQRPSAHRSAILSGAPTSPGASPNFTAVAASAAAVVAQGDQTDVFVTPADGWRDAGPTATLADAAAPPGGTSVSISGGTVVAGLGTLGTSRVEDVFREPPGGWSGTVAPVARLRPPGGGHVLLGGVIAGRLIAAQTTDANRPFGPVGVYVRPDGGWSGIVRPRARLLAPTGAETGFGLAVTSRAIFVSGISGVYVFTKPKRGWSGTIRPSARLHASGRVSVAGNTVLVGATVFRRPARGWTGTVKPSATVGRGFPTEQTSSPTALLTSDVAIPASGCVDGCTARVAATLKPRRGWTGHLRSTNIVRISSQTEQLPLALAGSNLFLTGGNDVRVYRFSH